MDSKFYKFRVGESVVYPSHGVGSITEITTQVIGGFSLEVYVVYFAHDKMSVKVPVSKAELSGLRKLISKKEVDEVYRTLATRPKRGNKMWSRRAQEYEAKIYSGDIILAAEVVRDLCKNADNERSFSERQIFEAAVLRVTTEISSITKTPVNEVSDKIFSVLREKMLSREDVAVA